MDRLLEMRYRLGWQSPARESRYAEAGTPASCADGALLRPQRPPPVVPFPFSNAPAATAALRRAMGLNLAAYRLKAKTVTPTGQPMQLLL
ncbi:hypothetical protein H5T51_05645 [Candidatus Bathyarchaeota archaeon]|nr:hypothetical protein [Candidatus Bathyarchaeota archaeon]